MEASSTSAPCSRVVVSSPCIMVVSPPCVMVVSPPCSRVVVSLPCCRVASCCPSSCVDAYVRPFVIIHPVAEGAGLFSAARRVVLWIEVENGLLPLQITSGQRSSRFASELDIGEIFPLFGKFCHVNPFLNVSHVLEPAAAVRAPVRA